MLAGGFVLDFHREKVLLKEKVQFCVTQALQWGGKQVFVDPAAVGLESLCSALQALKMWVLFFECQGS